MTTLNERIRAITERCKAVEDDPTFRQNAERLAEEWKAFEQRSAATARRDALRRAGVPEEHWAALDGPRDEEALRAVRRFLEGPDQLRFLVLAGEPGRGKSFALSWAVYRRGGRFVTAQELVAASTFDVDYWDDLEAAPVLAVEELGAEKPNDSYEPNLFGLLNRRYSRNRKTVLATNLGGRAFREKYLAAGLSRLVDRLETGGQWVALTGSSLRRHWQEAAETRGEEE